MYQQGLLDAISAERIDPSLFRETLRVPQGITDQLGNFGFFVAVHAAQWKTTYNTIDFYWDNSQQSIVFAGANQQDLEQAKDWFENTLFNDSNTLSQLKQQVDQTLSDTCNKRSYQEDPTDNNNNNNNNNGPFNNNDNGNNNNNNNNNNNGHNDSFNNNNNGPFNNSNGNSNDPNNHNNNHNNNNGPFNNNNNNDNNNDNGNNNNNNDNNNNPFFNNNNNNNNNPYNAINPALQPTEEQVNPMVSLQQGGDVNSQVVVLYLPEDKVGMVIGGQGKIIKLLKEITHCDIHIEKPGQTPNSPGRKVELRGSPEQVQHARDEINHIIRLSAGQQNLQDGQTGSDFIEVPLNAMGAIIGKQGDTIRLLQIKSHCFVSTEKDTDANKGFNTRKVFLVGTPEQVQVAKAAVSDIVKEFVASANEGRSQQFDPTQLLFGISNTKSRNITVNGSIIGLLIGQGGKNLREINMATGARAQVDKNNGAEVRTITLTAPNAASLQLATQMIKTKVEEISAKQAGGGNMNGGGLANAPMRPSAHGNNFNNNNNNNGFNNNNNNNNMNRNQGQQNNMYGHQQPRGIQQGRPERAAPQPQNPAMPANVQAQMFNPNLFMTMMSMNPSLLLGGLPQQQLQQQQQQQQQPQQQQQHQQPNKDKKEDIKDIKPIRPIPPGKHDTWLHYYKHYAATYTHQQALEYAQHYIENEPK